MQRVAKRMTAKVEQETISDPETQTGGSPQQKNDGDEFLPTAENILDFWEACNESRFR